MSSLRIQFNVFPNTRYTPPMAKSLSLTSVSLFHTPCQEAAIIIVIIVIANCFTCLVICATGFDVSFRPHYPTIGRNGVNLRDAWSVSLPESYLSVAAPHMPNYFTVLGPRALAGHGSLLEALSWNGDYMLKWIKKMAEEGIKSIAPKAVTVRHLMSYGDEIHKHLVWTGGCKSWYKQGTVEGKVSALFAGSGMLYKRLISDLRPEDFDIEYCSSNTFKFLGNGFTAFEFDPNNDLAWYIEK